MKNVKLDKIIIFRLTFIIFITFIECLRFIPMQPRLSGQFEDFLVYSSGYLNFESIFDDITAVIFIVVPQFYFMLILSDYFENNLYSQAAFIFTRTKRREKWIIKKILHLVIYAAIYSALYALVAFLFGLALKLSIRNHMGLIILILSEFVITFLNLLFLILLVNVLSIIFRSVYSLSFVFALDVFLYFCSEIIIKNKFLAMLMPSIHSLFYVHDLKFIARLDQPLRFYFSGFYVQISFVYYLILISITTIIGIIWINNKDII